MAPIYFVVIKEPPSLNLALFAVATLRLEIISLLPLMTYGQTYFLRYNLFLASQLSVKLYLSKSTPPLLTYIYMQAFSPLRGKKDVAVLKPELHSE